MSRNFARFRLSCSTTACKFFAVILFVGLCGLAVATLLVSRDPIPEDVTGSPTPAEYRFRMVNLVLDTGDFFTLAPDREAYVQFRYASPQAFKQLVHSYDRFEIPASQRVVTAALQQSDDGTSWTDVAEVSEPRGALVFDLGNVGAHKFWKVTVVKSGEAPEVVFGRLTFVRDGSILQRVPVDVVWLGLVPVSMLILIAFQVPFTPGRLFVVTALPVVLFVFAYALAYIGYPVVLVQDSAAYLQLVLKGSYASIRSAGYPTFLLIVQKTVGLDHVAWVQLGICVACYFAGARLLAARSASIWFGPALVLAFLLQGAASEFAPEVLTEALFTAGLGLFAAALGALARRPDGYAVAAAVVGIVLATLTKSVGVILVVPTLLLIRFLPKGKRLSVSGTIVVAGLAAYAALAVNNFKRTGEFTAESFAGYTLVGHVGWMLDDTYLPPSDLSRRLIDAAATVVARRPPDLGYIHSLATLDRYVDVTVGDYNAILWSTIFPIAEAELHTREKVNSYFFRLAISSIRAHPFLYMRHALAQFYGMWRDLGTIWSLREATIDTRRLPIYLNLDPYLIDLRSTIPAGVLTPSPNNAVLTGEYVNQSNLPLLLGRIWNSIFFAKGMPVLLGLLALFLSILFLIPGRLAYIYRAEIMMALSLNAYFGAHVLLQVTLQRYAATGAFVAIFLTVSFVFTSLCALRSHLAGRKKSL